MITPIWDAALLAAKDRLSPMRFHRWTRNRPWFVDFFINDPDLAQAIYLEALVHQPKSNSNDDAESDPPIS